MILLDKVVELCRLFEASEKRLDLAIQCWTSTADARFQQRWYPSSP